VSVTLLIEEPRWRANRGLGARIRRAALLAIARGGRGKGAVSVLLADDAALRALNAGFRGRDKPTNVLSFPSALNGYLGDVAIAYGTAAAEARRQAKSLSDHTLHLVVHGVLHLQGYDHEQGRDARVMESLETEVLAELGVADPHAGHAE